MSTTLPDPGMILTLADGWEVERTVSGLDEFLTMGAPEDAEMRAEFIDNLAHTFHMGALSVLVILGNHVRLGTAPSRVLDALAAEISLKLDLDTMP